MARLRDWFARVRDDWRWRRVFPEHQYRVACGDTAFQVYYRNRLDAVARVGWSDIRAIRTYKIDVFAYDVICLSFQVAADHWVEIGESFIGAGELFEQVSRRFPLVDADWYQHVMFPAFAPNDALLWRRLDEDGISNEELFRDLVHLRPKR